MKYVLGSQNWTSPTQPWLGLPSKKKDYDKAIGDYSEAITLDPTVAEAYYMRGLAYDYKGG
jgi:tetratricopeptide (TPR) repeat protein